MVSEVPPDPDLSSRAQSVAAISNRRSANDLSSATRCFFGRSGPTYRASREKSARPARLHALLPAGPAGRDVPLARSRPSSGGSVGLAIGSLQSPAQGTPPMMPPRRREGSGSLGRSRGAGCGAARRFRFAGVHARCLPPSVVVGEARSSSAPREGSRALQPACGLDSEPVKRFRSGPGPTCQPASSHSCPRVDDRRAIQELPCGSCRLGRRPRRRG